LEGGARHSFSLTGCPLRGNLNILVYSDCIIMEGYSLEKNLKELESRKVELFAELCRIGDMRRGSLTENYRRCGKAGCSCAQKGNSGHGPQYLLMTKEEG